MYRAKQRFPLGITFLLIFGLLAWAANKRIDPPEANTPPVIAGPACSCITNAGDCK